MRTRIASALGAFALIAAGLFFGASPVFATTYTSCSSVPLSVSGDADITDTSCSFGHSVTATGHIHITANSISGSGENLSAVSDVSMNATSGSITIGNVTSGSAGAQHDLVITATSDVTGGTLSSSGNLKVASSGGDISISGTVTSNTSHTAGNILLQANGNVASKSISTSGGSTGGSVVIEANTGGGSTLFTVDDGGSATNGVNGTIDVRVTSAGGTNSDTENFGIAIINGTSTSSGGITVAHMSDLLATASSSRSGIIALDAQNGTLTLPVGTLSVDGTSNYMAGSIGLHASTLATADGTIISSTQSPSSSGSSHFVVIGVNTVTVAGTNGLVIHDDGNGVSSGDMSTAWLGSQDTVSISSNGDYQALSVSIGLGTTCDPTCKSISVSGSGPLTMTANGKFDQAVVSAQPISFTNSGTLTITANGDSSEIVQITNPNIDGDTTDGLTFGGGNVTLTANGVSSVGDSGGGQVQIEDVNDLSTPTGTVTMSANGYGSGNGGQISIAPYNDTVTIGSAAGTFALSATGGSTGGNGGKIDLNVWNGVILDSSATSSSISLNALGGNGNGGESDIETCNGVTNNTTSGITLNANGIGSGSGGTFNWQSGCNAVPFNLQGSPAVASLILTAKGGDTGQGGHVTVNNAVGQIAGTNDLMDPATVINVDAGASTDSSTFDGSVQLNNVTCLQVKTGFDDWPHSYWDCADSSPTATDQILPVIANGFASSLRTTLDNNQVKLYVFSNPDDYNSFFANGTAVAPQDAGGFTINHIGSNHVRVLPIYVSVLENCSECGGTAAYHSLADSQVKEAAAHELGHASDFSFGLDSQSFSDDYDTNITKDLVNLDYDDPVNGHRRDACIGTGAPFAGLTDYSDIYTGGSAVMFCSGAGGTIRDKYRNEDGSAMSNSLILQMASYPWAGGDGNDDGLTEIPIGSGLFGWFEEYAQIFAYRAFTGGPPTPQFLPETDGVLNNYFSCTKAWADSVLAGSPSAPPSTCGPAIPDGYHPFQP